MAVCSLTVWSLAISSLRATFRDWFCLDARIRFVAGDDLLIDLAFEQALDVKEEPVLVYTDQRNGVSLLPCPGGPSDAMNVIFRNVWQLIVDDMR